MDSAGVGASVYSKAECKSLFLTGMPSFTLTFNNGEASEAGGTTQSRKKEG